MQIEIEGRKNPPDLQGEIRKSIVSVSTGKAWILSKQPREIKKEGKKWDLYCMLGGNRSKVKELFVKKEWGKRLRAKLRARTLQVWGWMNH